MKLVITSGTLLPSGQESHTITTLEVGVGARIFLTGGTIVRNQSDGYVIYGAAVSYQGSVSTTSISMFLIFYKVLAVESQSLLTAEAQRDVLSTLSSVTDYLNTNGSYLTPSQLDEVGILF